MIIQLCKTYFAYNIEYYSYIICAILICGCLIGRTLKKEKNNFNYLNVGILISFYKKLISRSHCYKRDEHFLHRDASMLEGVLVI